MKQSCYFAEVCDREFNNKHIGVNLFSLQLFATFSMRKRELVTLLSLTSWCLVFVVWLFLTMPRVYLQFVIVVFPDHTHLIFLCN